MGISRNVLRELKIWDTAFSAWDLQANAFYEELRYSTEAECRSRENVERYINLYPEQDDLKVEATDHLPFEDEGLYSRARRLKQEYHEGDYEEQSGVLQRVLDDVSESTTPAWEWIERKYYPIVDELVVVITQLYPSCRINPNDIDPHELLEYPDAIEEFANRAASRARSDQEARSGKSNPMSRDHSRG